jgi:hypothetical protein
MKMEQVMECMLAEMKGGKKEMKAEIRAIQSKTDADRRK